MKEPWSSTRTTPGSVFNYEYCGSLFDRGLIKQGILSHEWDCWTQVQAQEYGAVRRARVISAGIQTLTDNQNSMIAEAEDLLHET